MISIYEFHWKAKNRFGKTMKGKQLAENATQLEQQLMLKGFQQIKIHRNFNFTTTPKVESINQLLSQLALLLNTAMPLKQCLMLLRENCQQIRCYQWLYAIEQHLLNGFSLSDALKKESDYLSLQEIQLIKIGEQSGTLAGTLKTIAENRAKAEQLRKKIKKIMFYPSLVFGIALLLSLLMLLFIVPQFAELYAGKAHSLPFLTEILFQLSDFLSEHFWLSFFSITLLLCFVSKLSKVKPMAHFKTKLINILPIFRLIQRDYRTIFFCQNCGLMLSAGLRIDTILNSFITPNSPDSVLSNSLTQSLERLNQGYYLSESLDPSLFSDNVLPILAMGEKSGQLANMLMQISHYYQQKLDTQIDVLSQLLEPLLMLIIGSIIGTLLIGLYLPIFEMGTMIE